MKAKFQLEVIENEALNFSPSKFADPRGLQPTYCTYSRQT